MARRAAGAWVGPTAGLPVVRPAAAAPWPARGLCCVLVLMALLLGTVVWPAAAQGAPQAPADAPLRLRAEGPPVDAWPAITVYKETGDPLGWAQARARQSEFRAHTGPRANLGPHARGVWLRAPLVAEGGDGRWVLGIDAAPLHHVEVYLERDGAVVQHQRLGAALPVAARPLPSRVPALELQLEPGRPHVLWLRLQTHTALALPMQLSRPAQFQAREQRMQVVQGVLIGVALALVVSSLLQGLGTRRWLFVLYAGLLCGTTLFVVHFYGVGQQHLWPDSPRWQALVSPLSVLLALAAAGPFVALALHTRRTARRAHGLLLALAAVAAAAALLGLAGVLDYTVLRVVASALGVPLALVAAVVSARRWRQGDPVAGLMLLGWALYLTTGLLLVALLYGWVPATSWTLHAFQLGWLGEMIAWQRVLGVHIDEVRRRAERAELEQQALISMAQTDALTGLPNRRGLQETLARELAACRTGQQMLGVLMLDLDGFKQVNDRLGHDVGDALLVQVAQRLRSLLRRGDTVARLGGDEFVVLAPRLAAEADAQALGRKLLDAFQAPFDVAGQRCQVGLTIGLSLAPTDGVDGTELLKRADAAMYAGKQAGRHCLRRSAAAAAPQPELSPAA